MSFSGKDLGPLLQDNILEISKFCVLVVLFPIFTK